jgi:magnesium transporter
MNDPAREHIPEESTGSTVTPAPPVDPPQRVATQIEDMPADDGAQVLQDMPTGAAADVVEYLDPETAGKILQRMDAARAADIVRDMEDVEASTVLEHMPPDDRVDILNHIRGPAHDRIVDVMQPDDAAEVRTLEQYPPDTAGGIMTTEVTALYEYITVENAIALLRRLNEELEQMFYVYVIDRRRHLVGVLSMRDLILAKPDSPLRDIMIKNVRSVAASTDQEAVAQLMRKYGYLAIPVVDEQNKLVGLITLDDVIDVLEEETTEDVQRMFGAGAEERLNSPWIFSFKKRVWWLEVNLATAFMAAAVVGAFEGVIQQLAILAAYMPVVAGMGGNASAQAMSVSIRGLAVGRVDRAALRHVLRREFLVGLFTGIVVGATTLIIALIFHRDMGPQKSLALGLVICLALIINHALACVSGASIPFIMKSLGFDPAQSATIFATTVTDVVGFFTLLGLAYLFLDTLK